MEKEEGLEIVFCWTSFLPFHLHYQFWLVYPLKQSIWLACLFFLFLELLRVIEKSSDSSDFHSLPDALDAAFITNDMLTFLLRLFNTAEWGDLLSEIVHSDLYRTCPSKEDQA